MSIRTYHSSVDYFLFGGVPFAGQQKRLWNVWLKAYDVTTATGDGAVWITEADVANTDEQCGFGIAINRDGGWQYYQEDTGAAAGIWEEGSVLSADVEYLISTYYDNSSIANNPRLWVNNVEQAFTERISPGGSYPYGGNCTAYLMGNTLRSPSAVLHGMTVYNADNWSDAKIEWMVDFIYNRRSYIPTRADLVWAPMLWGAAGNPTDGSTMGSGNSIVELVSGLRASTTGAPTWSEARTLSLGVE